MTTIQAINRHEFSRSAKRKIREAGQIPAIVYGKTTESKPVAIDSIQLLKTIREEGKNTIIDLNVDGSSQNVMLSDMQTDPLKNEVIHVDFQIVDMKADIEVNVPIQLIGEAQGVKDGGVLQQSTHEITISAKPGDIPQTIDVDISNLAVNEALLLKDVVKNGSYTFIQDGDLVIASILPPQQEEEIDSGEEQEPGTPTNEEGREE